MQAISRAFSSWYELKYALNGTADTTLDDTNERFSLGMYATFVPIAGLGYFLIFLLTQPNAYKHFKKKFFCHKNYFQFKNNNKIMIDNNYNIIDDHHHHQQVIVDLEGNVVKIEYSNIQLGINKPHLNSLINANSKFETIS